ncbi:hypothetical protein [Caldisericum sp.]|uniref:hypothetical protein n=1 Tax=Caldisericum sp. TaxID=2499687 RepID=UPI003D13EF42
MKKKVKFTKIFIIFVVIEVICVLVYAGYLTFNLAYKSRQLSLKTAELQQYVATSTTIEVLKNQIKSGNKSMSDIQSSFFNDDTLLSFFKDFYDVCKSNGVELRRITFSNLTTVLDSKPSLKTLPVQINFSSDYRSVINLLDYLEKYKMHIKEVNLSIIRNDGTLNLVFYIFTNSEVRWVYEGKAVP